MCIIFGQDKILSIRALHGTSMKTQSKNETLRPEPTLNREHRVNWYLVHYMRNNFLINV